MDVVRFGVLGIGIGAAYVLLGQGLVVIFRGSGLVNFAQGAVAMMSAQVFYRTGDAWGLSTPVRMVVALGFAVLVGVAFQLAILRQLRRASMLAQLIATLALLGLLQGLALYWWTEVPRPVSSFLPISTLDFGNGTFITWSRVWILGIGVVLTIVLSFVYNRTRFGMATSAIAENPRSAATLGWSATKLGAVNWGIGCAIGALAGVLMAPIATLSVTALVLAVVPGIAVALLAGFSSFWLVLAAGLGMGIAEAEMARYVHLQGVSKSLPFLVIVGVLAVRGRALPERGERTERPPRVGIPTLSPGWLVVLGVVLAVALLNTSTSWLDAAITSLIFATLSLSVVVLTGYTGQLSLAQLAVAGVGALVAGNIGSRADLPFPLILLCAGAGAGVIGLAVGLPALRCRGPNLALATLGLGLAFEQLALGNATLTGGFEGLKVKQPSLFGEDLGAIANPQRYAVLCLVVLLLCVALVVNLRRGRVGRRLLAIRTNERAAAALGINVYAGKLYAFGLSAAIAGIGGALLAFRFTQVEFTTYTMLDSINLVVTTVIGGIGFASGAFASGIASVGGLMSRLLQELNDSTYVLLIALSGAVSLQVLLLHPDGVVDLLRHRFEWLRKILARGQDELRSTLFGKRRQSRGDDFGELPDDVSVYVVGQTLRIDRLSVRFGGVHALRDVSLEVRPGEVHGLIGPNGAGKSTLVDAVTGFVESSGEVWFGDTRIDRWSTRKRARIGVGRIFQSLELFEDLSVLENLKTAVGASGAAAYATDLIWPRPTPLPPVARLAIEDLAIGDILEMRPDQLSAGRRRCVAIARALATAPSVLLLDEPASTLGVNETAELANLIRHLAGKWGLAILLIEHDVDLVLKVSDRVTVLEFGEVIAEGDPATIAADPRVLAAYLGNQGATIGDSLPTRAEPVSS